MPLVAAYYTLRSADVFPVVASLPSFPDEKRRPEIRLRFAGYRLQENKKILRACLHEVSQLTGAGLLYRSGSVRALFTLNKN